MPRVSASYHHHPANELRARRAIEGDALAGPFVWLCFGPGNRFIPTSSNLRFLSLGEHVR